VAPGEYRNERKECQTAPVRFILRLFWHAPRSTVSGDRAFDDRIEVLELIRCRLSSFSLHFRSLRIETKPQPDASGFLGSFVFRVLYEAAPTIMLDIQERSREV